MTRSSPFLISTRSVENIRAAEREFSLGSPETPISLVIGQINEIRLSAIGID